MADAAILRAHRLTGPRGTDRVHDIDLDLRRGGLLHVHGGSGSGKTTLLRLLARLDPRESGQLRLDGVDAEEITPTHWRRRVSLVFQESRVFPATIEENLRWGAQQHGMHADVPRLLERVGLELAADTPAARISGGEAKRLAIARALAVDPDVLLLDEPTGPLDEDNRNTLRGLIGRLGEEGLGVVLVSHLDEDLRLLPGEAIHLRNGRVQSRGESGKLHKALQEERP